MSKKTDDNQFVIIRSTNAGVFAGYLKDENVMARAVVLDGCIRLHAWFGASLSQLAVEGSPDHKECRFAMPVDGHKIYEVIEILPCTEVARKNLQSCEIWRVGD